MRIVYVARHDGHDNDDEGAIATTLSAAGHEVMRVHEAAPDCRSQASVECELLLFHKWDNDAAVSAARARVKALWHFDMVESDDWELQERSAERVAWFDRMLPVVDLAFVTDGDWMIKGHTAPVNLPGTVLAEHGRKIKWLTQGADMRVLGSGDATRARARGDVLFAGSTIHGGRRQSHVAHLRRTWGQRFTAFGHHPRDRVHGRKMADLVAGFKIVVAPDGPTTDRYWSNRVYQALGFGAFLLHPRCSWLGLQYWPDELITYGSRDELDTLIERYLSDPDARKRWADAGYKATVARNLYSHRVAELVERVRQLL